MAIPDSFTFYTDTVNTITWTVEQNGAPYTNASVQATLYYGRSKLNPASVPGVSVPNATDLSLVYNSTNKDYELAFLLPSSSAAAGGDYVLVVNILDDFGSQLDHVERPSVVSNFGA